MCGQGEDGEQAEECPFVEPLFVDMGANFGHFDLGYERDEG